MRSTGSRAATLAAIIMVATGCGVSDNDIEHWKHTQRGPRKITTVLVNAQYERAMRVHAARALIEMKHPNASGLDLLQSAFSQMSPGDREPIIHELIPELQRMMATAAPSGQGPTEQQIKAKDAAYVLIHGDGHASFTNADDRGTLATLALDWVLADFNTRALAGSYTAEQLVNAIGPTAVTRLTASLNGEDASIPVSVEIAKLINAVGNQEGKTAASQQLVRVCTEMESPSVNTRLRAKATELLRSAQREPTEAALNVAVGQLREQYLTILFEAIRTLGQPDGSTYLLRVAHNAATPLARRKTALNAMASTTRGDQVPQLLEIAACAPGPQCDIDLRGLAIDRIGDSRNRGAIASLWPLYDAANGGTANQEFTLRWKLGEAILKLGGPAILPEFVQHLGLPRVAPFAGFTFAELNGEAQAVGDMTPQPRDAMRGYLAPVHPVPVRLLAIMFLGIKGEQRDVATLQAMASDATPIQGEGWSDQQLTTVGSVANRARDQLQQALRSAQQTGQP